MGKMQKTIEKKKCVHHEILYFGMEGFGFFWNETKNGQQPSKLKKYARGPSLGAFSLTGLLYPNVQLVCSSGLLNFRFLEGSHHQHLTQRIYF